MAKAVTNERETHFTMKEICEMVLTFFKMTGIQNLSVKTEEALGRLIPDVLYYSGDTLIACLEVVNFNPMSKSKIVKMKNMNITLYSVKVTNWTVRNDGIPFHFWKQDFVDFFTDVMNGINNGNLVETHSLKDLPSTVILNANHVHLVRYEVLKCEGHNRLFELMAYDSSNNSYHLLFTSEKARNMLKKKNKTISSFKRGTEPLYHLRSEEQCWIDALLSGPTFRKL